MALEKSFVPPGRSAKPFLDTAQKRKTFADGCWEGLKFVCLAAALSPAGTTSGAPFEEVYLFTSLDVVVVGCGSAKAPRELRGQFHGYETPKQ